MEEIWISRNREQRGHEEETNTGPIGHETGHET